MTLPPRSRFLRERPIVRERESRVVALVGFPSPLTAVGGRILERCGLDPLEFADISSASRFLTSVKVDALVLDGHHAGLKQLSPQIETVLRLVTVETSYDAERTALIVLTASEVAAPLLTAYRDAGAAFLASGQQSYRQIAIAARQLCGLPDRCCQETHRPALG